MSKSLMREEASAYLDSLISSAFASLRFHIHTGYHVTVPETWRIEERVLDEAHLLYVKSGCVNYFVEGEHLELGAGNLLYLSDGITHSTFRNPQEPLTIIPIRFRMSCYDKSINDRGMARPSYFSFLPRDTHKFRLLFETVHRHYCLPPSRRRELLCHSSICQVLGEMSLELEKAKPGKLQHPAILHIKNHIDAHPADRLSVQELALQSGLSPKYFSQLFQQSFGQTIKAYQLKTRIEYAKYLLEHTNQSVKEIAFHLGYPDPFAFSKQYKAITGIAPSQTMRDCFI